MIYLHSMGELLSELLHELRSVPCFALLLTVPILPSENRN
jgi:hypothetical protein